MTGGRPRRPAAEARLVREALAGMDPSAPREPIARALAARVVGHLRGVAAEASDPAVAAFGQLRRAVLPCPAVALAADPDINTLAEFIDARVKSLRKRNGWTLTAEQDRADVESCLAYVQVKLAARYLKILRT